MRSYANALVLLDCYTQLHILCDQESLMVFLTVMANLAAAKKQPYLLSLSRLWRDCLAADLDRHQPNLSYIEEYAVSEEGAAMEVESINNCNNSNKIHEETATEYKQPPNTFIKCEE
jgi:hypothetical protein